MSNIPENPIMLYSWINTMLRDRYDSLDALCEDMNLDVDVIKKKLAGAGFTYQPEINQFR